MPFWGWLIIGGILAIVELLTFTFVLLFFALGAVVAAAIAWLGVSQFTQIMTFAAASLLLLFLFRKRLLKNRLPSSPVDVGATFTLTTALPGRSEGVVNYQGSPWTAVNLESENLSPGDMVSIEKTEGIKLFVKRRSS